MHIKDIKSFKDIKENMFTNVGELMDLLEKYPRDTKIMTHDADGSGYDVTQANYGIVRFEKEYDHVNNCDSKNDVLCLSHMQYHIEHMFTDGLLTEEEYNVLTT